MSTYLVSLRKVIVWISGTPGVGKTVIGRKVARLLKGKFIDIPEFVKRAKAYLYYDRKSRTYVVDVRGLRMRLLKEVKVTKKDTIVVSGHLIFKLRRNLAVRVFVLRLSPTKLEKRLLKRGYPKSKLSANLVTELTDAILYDAIKAYGNKRVSQLNVTDVAYEEVALKISEAVKNDERIYEHVDWIEYLEKEGRLEKFLKLYSRYT